MEVKEKEIEREEDGEGTDREGPGVKIQKETE